MHMPLEDTLGLNLLAANQHQAEHNRDHFDAWRLLCLNVMSSPGAGKTSLLEQTLTALSTDLAMAVLEGDMTTPPVGPGDLFIVTVGPGEISTALALLGVARDAGADIMVLTAQPQGRAAGYADFVLTIPAQTMADDQGDRVSILPMGSLYEGALFLLFEVMILKLRDRLGVTPELMRANHTNLE